MSLHPATQVAYKHLSRYPKTIRQTREYLTKKDYEPDEIDTAIAELIDLQVLDDTIYAEAYLHGEVTRKGKPLMVAKQKLYHKGVDSAITQSLVDQYGEDYQAGMRKALTKLWNSKKDSDETQKWIKRMMGRGYGYEVVKSVVGEE